MITLYPPALLSSVTLVSGEACAPSNRRLYLSFEDALGALLAAHIKPQAKVLVPAYYCWSVVHHLERKGFQVFSYPVGEDLQPDRAALESALKHHSPQLVILFHPLGIESTLKKDLSWTAHLLGEAIVLEDYAHRLFSDLDAHPFQRWVAINSFRKLSAAEGAWIWGAPHLLGSLPPPAVALSWYSIKVRSLFILWRAVLQTAGLFESQHLFSLSEKLYGLHEELIGASETPQGGSRRDEWLFSRLNGKRLSAHREKIARIYLEKLRSHQTPKFSLVPIEEDALKDLKFFPVRIQAKDAAGVLARLSERRVYLDTLYEDSPHSQGFAYLMLPLYPTIDEAQAHTLGEWLHAEIARE